MPIIYRPEDHSSHRCPLPCKPDWPDSTWRIPWDIVNEHPLSPLSVWECPLCGTTWAVRGDEYLTWWREETKEERRQRRRLARKPKEWVR